MKLGGMDGEMRDGIGRCWETEGKEGKGRRGGGEEKKPRASGDYHGQEWVVGFLFLFPPSLSLFPSGEKVDGAPFGVVCCTRKFFSVYHKGRKKKTEKEEEALAEVGSEEGDVLGVP